jgi:hypothetical protein
MPLKILIWNAHCVKNKKSELLNFIAKYNVDVLLLNETWLTNADNFSIPNFQMYRTDRIRGGTAIIIKSSILHSFSSGIKENYAEATSIRIFTEKSFVTFTSIYCSPAASRLQSQSFYKKVLKNPGSNLIAGDFNCKHIAWNNTHNDHKGLDLFNLIDANCYKIHPPNHPTHFPYIGKPSCLDFVISKNFTSNLSLSVINDLSSDHLPLLCSLSFHRPSSHVAENSLNFSKANWKRFENLVDSSIRNVTVASLDSHDSIDCYAEKITDCITQSLSLSVPKIKPRCYRYKFSPIVNNLVKQRNHFRNLYKRTMNNGYKSSVNQLNRLIRKQIQVEKSDSFNKKLKVLSSQDNSLFQFTKSLKRKKTFIPPLSSNNHIAYSDLEKANTLAASFANNHQKPSVSLFECIVRKSNELINDLNEFSFSEITNDEILCVIDSLNIKKAAGPDKIPNQAILVLKKTRSFLFALSHLFNSCLKLSFFPKLWKNACIIPVPKKNSPVSVDDFRPISLISCLGKILEKILLQRLSDFEREQNIIIPQQFGFRSEHSTVQQIMRIVENATFGFNQNLSTGLMLLDLRKAFDSVWHDGLIHKLIRNNYPPYLIKLIASYLRNRSAFVSVNNAHSTSFNLSAGVPQGSLLAPHLFNIFINDMPVPKKGQLALYADDAAYYVQAPWKNLNAIKKDLLCVLGIFNNYFNNWKIQLNQSKCEFIMLTKSSTMLKKTQADRIIFNKRTLAWSSSVRYLGFHLDSKLLFQSHINAALMKAKALAFSTFLCFVKRNSSASLKSKLTVYRSLIRPTLTYACPVFSNCAKTHFIKLERLENKILRSILNIGWDDFISNEHIHLFTKIPTLREFVDKLTHNFYVKCKNHSNELVAGIGNYDVQSLGFGVKHRLPKAL